MFHGLFHNAFFCFFQALKCITYVPMVDSSQIIKLQLIQEAKHKMDSVTGGYQTRCFQIKLKQK